jgi:predicted ArsR family transcriptional regulator
MKVNGQEYITIKEIAKILKVEPNTIKQRLFQHGIKPVSKEALYDLSVLDTIRETPMGRPKKAVMLEPDKGNPKKLQDDAKAKARKPAKPKK